MSIHSEFNLLSLSEKVRVVQDLWDEIAAEPERLPIPEWHGSELAAREREWASSPDPGQDWVIVKERIANEL
ncbi:addiction module protein [Sulfidibacter corallicola]|uniref:Addiction module protein n=1 Tax=Sulfidibacter corallicola TaxID=2818388 RepID=A0A8A4TUL8_SULCO|nr:addiction module protein [Sulfidibacter corallicola]QTD53210.1 addiction module protein [Sulfidibacter corallicola]